MQQRVDRAWATGYGGRTGLGWLARDGDEQCHRGDGEGGDTCESGQRGSDLFAGSWIDEPGSTPRIDLGTWIGEAEENRAWELLGQARALLTQEGASPDTARSAFDALYLAEGSDWFWWFGQDQESGGDEEFDDLFRTHLKNIHRGLGAQPPAELDRSLVPRTVLWTCTAPVAHIGPKDPLAVRTNTPSVLTWWTDEGHVREGALTPVGGVLAGIRRYALTLGPFPTEAREVRFRCTHPGCDGQGPCCSPGAHLVRIAHPDDQRSAEREAGPR